MEWILLSLLPVVENRGGIPLAISLGVNPVVALLVCSLASFTGGFVTYLLLEQMEPVLRMGPLRPLYEYFVDRVRKKGKKYVERYGKYALFFFVAIPLPGSGAYTGALFAYLFGMPPLDTAAGLFTGSLTAGVLVVIASVSLMALV